MSEKEVMNNYIDSSVIFSDFLTFFFFFYCYWVQ